MDGWVDGWVGGWVRGWTGAWVDGWVGGWVRQLYLVTVFHVPQLKRTLPDCTVQCVDRAACDQFESHLWTDIDSREITKTFTPNSIILYKIYLTLTICFASEVYRKLYAIVTAILDR